MLTPTGADLLMRAQSSLSPIPALPMRHHVLCRSFQREIVQAQERQKMKQDPNYVPEPPKERVTDDEHLADLAAGMKVVVPSSVAPRFMLRLSRLPLRPLWSSPAPRAIAHFCSLNVPCVILSKQAWHHFRRWVIDVRSTRAANEVPSSLLARSQRSRQGSGWVCSTTSPLARMMAA